MSRLDRRLQYLALSLLSGILLGAPFLWPFLWWLEYVALVPWAVLLTREEVRAGWLYFFVGACAFFVIALLPFALFHKTVPFLLAAFYGPFLLPFAILFRTIYQRYRPPLVLLAPAVWVAAEWLRLRFSIGQVHIFPLGSSQFAQLRLIQIADLTGVAGISFIVAAASGAVADIIVHRRRWGWLVLWSPSTFLMLLTAALAYGTYRLAAPHLIEGPRLALVQPNVKHHRDPALTKATLDKQLAFTRAEIAPGTADLVVLPENAVTEPIGDDPSYMEEVGALAREQGARLIVGAFSRASIVPPRVYTSAYYLSEDGELLSRYHKLHLIPWAEYMPFEGWLPRLSPALDRAHNALAGRLLGYNSFGVPGKELVLFSLKSEGREVRFATPICFEVSNGEFGREAVAKGADFLLNITSEGVFGPAVYTHMFAHSRIRAVENRVAVVRVGNNGISGIIEPDGRIRSLVRGKQTGRLYLEEGSLVDRVPINPQGSGSFFTRHGDLLAYCCVAASLLLLAASFLPSKLLRASRAPGISSRP